MTCWRRLRDWQAAGVWDKLHLAMLRRLREHDQIDWGRVSLDAASVPSPRGPGNRTQSNGSWQARKQAAPGRRCPRRSLGDHDHWRQPA
jgi:hypothetical protein